MAKWNELGPIHDAWQLVFEAAGFVGDLDIWELSLRELDDAARGRRYELWMQTAAITATIKNVNRGKNTKPFTPAGDHPMHRQKRTNLIPLTNENFDRMFGITE